MARLVASALSTVVGLVGVGQARATPTAGLAFEFDESGSILGLPYAAEQTAYINAFKDLLPTDGSVALEFDTFGTVVRSVFPLQTITSGTKAALITALQRLYQYGGSTASGPAIQKATSNLLAFSGLTSTYVNVSTDGSGTIGIRSSDASAIAVTSGITQVNVLCLGGDPGCAFNAGVGSSDTLVTQESFEASLRTLIESQLPSAVILPTVVPEPTSFASLGFGLAGLAAMKRRQRKGRILSATRSAARSRTWRIPRSGR